MHAGTVVGKLEGDPNSVQGFYNVLREPHNAVDLQRGIFFEQDWAGLRNVMPVASGGIHAGQMHQLLTYLGEDTCCSSAAARSVIRWASPPARLRIASRSKPWCWRATRVATSGTKARRSSPTAARHCAPLRAALDTWGEVTFNYTSTDTPDFIPTPTAA